MEKINLNTKTIRAIRCGEIKGDGEWIVAGRDYVERITPVAIVGMENLFLLVKKAEGLEDVLVSTMYVSKIILNPEQKMKEGMDGP